MQNKKYRLVPFEQDHFFRMPLRPEDEADLDGLDMLGLFPSWQGGFTALYDDKPVCIFGGNYDEGVVTMWAVTGLLTDRLPLAVTKEARALITAFFNRGAHRIQVYCHKDNKKSFDWLQRALGFSLEGFMRKSGPNKQDRFLFSLVDDDFRRLSWAH